MNSSDTSPSIGGTAVIRRAIFEQQTALGSVVSDGLKEAESDGRRRRVVLSSR